MNNNQNENNNQRRAKFNADADAKTDARAERKTRENYDDLRVRLITVRPGDVIATNEYHYVKVEILMCAIIFLVEMMMVIVSDTYVNTNRVRICVLVCGLSGGLYGWMCGYWCRRSVNMLAELRDVGIFGERGIINFGNLDENFDEVLKMAVKIFNRKSYMVDMIGIPTCLGIVEGIIISDNVWLGCLSVVLVLCLLLVFHRVKFIKINPKSLLLMCAWGIPGGLCGWGVASLLFI